MKFKSLSGLLTWCASATAPLWLPATVTAQSFFSDGSDYVGSGYVDSSYTTQEPYVVRYQTVYERRPVKTYRLETETVYEKQKVTTYRPKWETEVRERRYRVARRIPETSLREEKYTVLRPVTETAWRDESYDRVRWVHETEMREESRTVYRPVYETQEREERVVVQRPVTETAEYDEVSTHLAPVTTYRPTVVDAGGYLDQWSYSTPRTRNRLQWLGRQEYVNPATGLAETQRGGLYWVPQAARGTYSVQRVYVPNYMTTAVPETSYVPQQVTRRVAVPVTTYRDEVEVRKVPVTVQRMEAQEEVRQVPVTVERPVRERVERKVPIQRTRYLPEEVVRKIPVTTYRVAYEEKVEEVPVRVCRMETIEQEVIVPKQRKHWVAYQSSQMVPRQVPVHDPCADPCSAPFAALDGNLAPSSEWQRVDDGASDTGITESQEEPSGYPESEGNSAETERRQRPAAGESSAADLSRPSLNEAATEAVKVEEPPVAPVSPPILELPTSPPPKS